MPLRSLNHFLLAFLFCVVAVTFGVATKQPEDVPPSDPLLMQIGCGLAQGTWITVPNRPDSSNPQGTSRVAAWHNIPFAAPPIGNLRWQPPQTPACWTGVLNATTFGNVCAQDIGFGTEDCLYLSVYVPERILTSLVLAREIGDATSASTPGSPVLFYIHGGGLTGGSGNFEVLAPFVAHAGLGDPSGESIISVVINYRLNMFGFLTMPEMAETQDVAANFGLLDQIAALNWVQSNVGYFGGDPSRVTIAGQSSGGTSIFGLMSSNLTRGLFSGAISLSGSINTSMTIQQGFEQNSGIATSLGCANSSSSSSDPTTVMACMREQSIDALLNAVPSCWGTPHLWGISDLTPSGRNFCGFIFIDGVTVQTGFPDALAIGLIDIPLIIGNMGQEADLAPEQDIYGSNISYWQSLLNSSVVNFNIPQMGGELYDMYESDSNIDPSKAYCSFNTDYGLTCGTIDLLRAAKLGGIYSNPLYFFVNQWAPSKPVLLGTRSAHWAYHTFDWAAVCENWPITLSPNAKDWELSSLLQTIWFEFIRTGRVESTGWQSIEEVEGFPTNYASFLFNVTGSGPTENYKADTCQSLEEFGFNQNFWWCD